MRAGRYFGTMPTFADGAMPDHTPVDIGGRIMTSPGGNVITVTPVLDTLIYAADDLLFDSTIIAAAVPFNGGISRLESVTLLDEDDQGVALDLLLLDASTTLGTINGAFAASDTLGRNVLARVNIATGDYVDFGGFRIAQKSGLGLIVEAASSTTSLWVAAVTRGGTPTHTASGMKIKFGFSYI